MDARSPAPHCPCNDGRRSCGGPANERHRKRTPYGTLLRVNHNLSIHRHSYRTSGRSESRRAPGLCEGLARRWAPRRGFGGRSHRLLSARATTTQQLPPRLPLAVRGKEGLKPPAVLR